MRYLVLAGVLAAATALPIQAGAQDFFAGKTMTIIVSTGAGNAEHHRTKDDGADQHLDQRNEAIAEGLQADGRRRIRVAKQAAGEDGQPHPEVQVPGQALHARSSQIFARFTITETAFSMS